MRTIAELGRLTGANFFVSVRTDDSSISVRVVNIERGTVVGNATEMF